MRYLHTMVRVTDLDASLHFYSTLFGLTETRRYENEKGRFHSFSLLPARMSTRREAAAPPVSSSLITGIRRSIPEDATSVTSPTRSMTSTQSARSLWTMALQSTGRPATVTWLSCVLRTAFPSRSCRRAPTLLRPSPGLRCPTLAPGKALSFREAYGVRGAIGFALAGHTRSPACFRRLEASCIGFRAVIVPSQHRASSSSSQEAVPVPTFKRGTSFVRSADFIRQ